ncbi:MAG: acyl-CoA dehydrogenase family protein [Vulcanimicrobiaceae bacterium]
MAPHDVYNQSPPFERINLFTSDRALVEGIAREAPGADEDEMHALGALAGHPETIQLGFDANEHPPELHTHDAYGNRIDEVRFHPAWHVLMHHATAHGLHASPWVDTAPYAHAHRAAKFYLWSQVEAGHGCPISMTYAAIPALRHEASLTREWEPKFAARAYDPRLLPIAQKKSAICGMGLTEKQGGSDVRANQTQALPASAARGSGTEYVLDGHKWFCSAPMSDAFLMLARTDGGLGCFFVPRVLPDGTRNPFVIQRLKDKLGNRSNASGEIELDGTHGWMVGEDGRGVQTIVEMINQTRLDCMIGSASGVRHALAQAIHHATYRETFGSKLIDHPAMRNVLADLAIESEAATALFLRIARASDESPNSAHAAALKRIGTAVGKYFLCKRAPTLVAEALECLGGNGYVEASIMPRLYREAPVNSLWEGSGSINALDVLRIARKQPEAIDAFRQELVPALSDPRIAAAARDLERDLLDRAALEVRVRSIVERMALLWQASLLMQHAPAAVSDAFIASRIVPQSCQGIGTLDASTDFTAIIDRAAPH